MISFIFRFAFVSFLGMLMNPGQLAHKLPSEAQIMHVTQQIEQDSNLRTLLGTRYAAFRKDLQTIKHTVRQVRGVISDVRNTARNVHGTVSDVHNIIEHDSRSLQLAFASN